MAVTGSSIYVGTSSGLYRTDTPTGPLDEIGFQGKTVDGARDRSVESKVDLGGVDGRLDEKR